MLSTKDILKRLRALREEKYLKQEFLARQLGIDRTTYIRKEKGRIPITTDEWLRLAQAMGRDLTYFFLSDNAPAANGVTEGSEELLVRLYRSLSIEEKQDLISCLRLILKGVKRKGVRDTIDMLGRV
ncbi:MAG: helix-turn-helix domain-containing protein [Deltaproteobacteria bacterium]|nr:helix-turn-helix domain-containing protein [Deltaproteobacteria bacterium]